MSDNPFEGPDEDSGSEEHLAQGLAAALGYDAGREPPPDRVAALRAAAERMGSAGRRTPSRDARRRARRRAAVAGGLAGGVGGVVGYLAPEVDPERTPGSSEAPTARAFPSEVAGAGDDEPPAPA